MVDIKKTLILKNILKKKEIFTWDSCRSTPDVKGRGLEGIDDVTLRYAGQVIIIKERAMETCFVDLC